MALSIFPHKKVPTNCGECEFSFLIDDTIPIPLYCCVRNNTHHAGHQILCPWYVRLGLDELKIELASTVTSWHRAILIRDLLDHTDVPAIVNIIDGVIGSLLANPPENHHEKQDHEKTP